MNWRIDKPSTDRGVWHEFYDDENRMRIMISPTDDPSADAALALKVAHVDELVKSADRVVAACDHPDGPRMTDMMRCGLDEAIKGMVEVLNAIRGSDG